MKNYWLKGLVVIFFLNVFVPAYVAGQSSNTVTGRSSLAIKNDKNIHDPKNKKSLLLLQRDAVLDAIGQGAPETIIITNIHKLKSNKEGNEEEVFEAYDSKTRISQHVKWQRKGSFVIERDKFEHKQWNCSIEGVVTSIPITDDDEPGEIGVAKSKENHIARKKHNIVYIWKSKESSVSKKDKYLAYDIKKLKTSSGSISVTKPKGLIYVTNVSKDRFKGRILKGVYKTHKDQPVAKVDFQTKRKGLEYQFAGSFENINNQVQLVDVDDTSAVVDSYTHTLYFFNYSLVKRTGFKLGFEIYDTQTRLEQSDSLITGLCYVPKINLNFSIGLVPDFLYLRPGGSIGYVFTGGNDAMYQDPDKDPIGANVVLEAEISAHLRLWRVELVGGVTYKFIYDLPHLTNYYPHVGISYNFIKYKNDTFDID